MRPPSVRQTSVALERRVRAILAARRCGYRFDERDAALAVVVERVWRDIAAMTAVEPDEPEEPNSRRASPVSANGLRLIRA